MDRRTNGTITHPSTEWRQSVEKNQYQELFGICQVTPGPASTKMIYSICAIRGGFGGAALSFLIWRYLLQPFFFAINLLVDAR